MNQVASGKSPRYNLRPLLSEAAAMRCAIYTRVSTDEQAQPEYNSLQLQAELCQHYIEVQWEQGRVGAEGSDSGRICANTEGGRATGDGEFPIVL